MLLVAVMVYLTVSFNIFQSFLYKKQNNPSLAILIYNHWSLMQEIQMQPLTHYQCLWKMTALNREILFFRMNWQRAFSCLIICFHLSSIEAQFRFKGKMSRCENIIILSFYSAGVFVIYTNRIFQKCSQLVPSADLLAPLTVCSCPSGTILSWERQFQQFLFNSVSSCLLSHPSENASEWNPHTQNHHTLARSLSL